MSWSKRNKYLSVIIAIALLAVGGGLWARSYYHHIVASTNLYYGLSASCRFYAVDGDNLYPSLSSLPGTLMIKAEMANYMPSYAEDLVYPGETIPEFSYRDGKAGIDDHTYIYLGYLISSQEEFETFAEVYRARVEEGLDFDEDLAAPDGKGSLGTDTFYRLRADNEDLTEENVAFEFPDSIGGMDSDFPVPVFVQRPRGRIMPGGLVSFLDGRIRFMRYPSEFPMTEEFWDVIESLDELEEVEMSQ